MRPCFSTLGCPGWTLAQAIAAARRERYEGIELRFVEGDAALWKRPEFVGSGLTATRTALRDAGLAVACVDTSCFFHWPDPGDRRHAMDEARRMLELAAQLGAPAIRVFGDRVQPGAARGETEGWIVEALGALGEEAVGAGLEVWLETHGDFAPAAATCDLIERAGKAGIGVIWDPANAFAEHGESPECGYPIVASLVRHVHLKDLRSVTDAWEPALPGTGQFPAAAVVALLAAARFRGFVSFEWEKRWHPSIEEPDVALPHFARWYRGQAVSRPAPLR